MEWLSPNNSPNGTSVRRPGVYFSGFHSTDGMAFWLKIEELLWMVAKSS